MKINFGSGSEKRYMNGWVNLDKKDVDLNHPPYNLKDNCVEEIMLDNVIEHLCPMKYGDVFREFYRILEPGGLLYIRVPSFSCHYPHTRSFWYVDSFDALTIPNCSDVDSANNFEKVYVKPNIPNRLCLLVSIVKPFMLEFCFRKKNE